MTAIRLRDYQEAAVGEVRLAFRDKQDPVLFVLPTGGGKCLGAGTPVLMFDGTIKPVEDVLVGDLLMGPDSNPRRVLSLARGREKMYRVTPTKGDAYVVNESHILSLRHRQGAILNLPVLECVARARRSPDFWMKWLGWAVPGVLRGDLRTRRTHITVTPIGEGDYFGFEIDGDHLFMLGDFTVTHNTYTFSYIAHSAAERKRAVCIIVHRKELLLQASASLRNLGITHGLISPDFSPNRHALVQVASVDTLLQRLKKQTYSFGLLIFDEAHHVVDGNKWGRVYEQLGKPPMLGVTATPVRTDGKGLGEHAGGVFKTMVLGPSVVELIDRGMLLAPKVFASPVLPELEDLRVTRDGDYNQADVVARVDKPRITGSAVDHYTKLCPGRRAIVFCSGIEHAKHVRDQFNESGYRFALLVGAPHMSDTERTAVNVALRKGEIDGACTVDLVSEGYDLPDLECCIMLRPTASEALFLQQVGRVMRPSPGKTECFLLDHVGNVGTLKAGGEFKRKHGLPNEERDWTLDGRQKKKKKAKDEPEDLDDLKIAQCPQCFTTHEKAPNCPTCGHEYVVKTRSLEQVDGELNQITAEMQERFKAQQRSAQAAAKSVEDMMNQLGYSRGRAEAVFKAREEKAALSSGLHADMAAWRDQTGQTSLQLFNVAMSELKYLKPKALKELRQKFDDHRRKHLGARPGDDVGFAQHLQQTLLTNDFQPSGDPAF